MLGFFTLCRNFLILQELLKVCVSSVALKLIQIFENRTVVQKDWEIYTRLKKTKHATNQYFSCISVVEGELCCKLCSKTVVSLWAVFLKVGIHAHLADITKVHRLKRDLETDSSKMTTLRGFFLIWPSAVMSRGCLLYTSDAADERK